LDFRGFNRQRPNQYKTQQAQSGDPSQQYFGSVPEHHPLVSLDRRLIFNHYSRVRTKHADVIVIHHRGDDDIDRFTSTAIVQGSQVAVTWWPPALILRPEKDYKS
jgi:hypothetical protein